MIDQRRWIRFGSLFTILVGTTFVGCEPTAPTVQVAPADSVTIAVTGDSFADVVLGSDQPVLVDFWAAWCGPCRKLAPTVEAVAIERRDRLTVAKVDVDAHPELAAEYNITGIPTLILFDQGREVDRIVGLVDQIELESHLP